MGLRPTDEAPPRALATRVMELSPTHTLFMFHHQSKSSLNTNIMYNNQSYNSCFSIHRP